MAAPERVPAGTNEAAAIPSLLATRLLYPLIAAAAPSVPASLTDCLISPLVKSVWAASFALSFPVVRKTEEVRAFPKPLAVNLAPCRAARYAAPPAPAMGAVATERTAVAATSTRRGAIVSPISWKNPKSSPKSLATSRLSELRRAEFTSVSCAQLAPNAAGTAAASWVTESQRDQATPFVRSANSLKFSSSARKSDKISWLAWPVALPFVRALLHSSDWAERPNRSLMSLKLLSKNAVLLRVSVSFTESSTSGRAASMRSNTSLLAIAAGWTAGPR